MSGYFLSYKDEKKNVSGAVFRVFNVAMLECVTPATVRLLTQKCGGAVLSNRLRREG